MIQHMKRNMMGFFALFLVGCATVSGWMGSNNSNESQGVTALKKEEKSPDDLKALLEQQTVQMARLSLEVKSMGERVATMRRQIQVLSRGNRSGIFYEDPSADGEGKLGFEEAPATPNLGQVSKTQKPQGQADGAPNSIAKNEGDLKATVGRTGFHEEVDEAEGEAEEQPAKLISDAELKMRRSQYGEALVSLKELEKRYPNYSDDGHASIMMAEAWLKLGAYENTLPVLRSFYLKHPNSADMLRAKLLEAQAHEGAGNKEKAAGIYREIVAQGPQTGFAQQARASLQRLRDLR